MRKITFLVLLFAATLQAQIVNIPDPEFKNALLNAWAVPTIDANQDGEIQISEAAAVQEILEINGISQVDDVTGLEAFVNLKKLLMYNFNNTTIDLSEFAQLEIFHCTSGALQSFVSTNSLKEIDVNSNYITSIDFSSGFDNLEKLVVRDNNLTDMALGNLSNLKFLDCSQNSISTLALPSSLVHLECNVNEISSLNLTNMTALEIVYIMGNNLSSLQLPTSVKSLNIAGNPLLGMNDFSAYTSLETLMCDGNNLQQLNVSGLTQLIYLSCSENILSALDVSTNLALRFLYCPFNELNSLVVSHLSNLEFLDCSFNQLTELEIAGLQHLSDLRFFANLISEITFNDLPQLNLIWAMGNLFTTVDASQLTRSFSLDVENCPNLVYINIKNGESDYLNCDNSPSLFICADEEEVQSFTNDSDFENVNFSTYCNFTPGGEHNTISGTFTFDYLGNGCASSLQNSDDYTPPAVKVVLDDGTNTGVTFTDANGHYQFYTNSGNFTITPEFENPYFTISPGQATVNFSEDGGQEAIRSFCFSSVGIRKDLEVMLVPYDNVAPGFDTYCKVIFKNVGTQTMSGTVTLAFQDDVLDFLSSVVPPDNQNGGLLTWNFSNFMPFETRSTMVTFNLNGPMETPPANLNDILHYTATINPIPEDETPENNVFELNVTVGGSYDPNDKTCLQGNTMTPEMVGDYLHYLIRFQNTGADPAVNVVVVDEIDATKFDIDTFQLMDSSHPHTTRITGTKVEFIFENIMLPAEEDDEPGSHGFIVFKIKTKSNLVLGNSVSNKADIYFDFNYPVITEPAVTTVTALGVGNHQELVFNLYPNPAKESLFLHCEYAIETVEIFNLQGRKLHSAKVGLSQTTLDIADLASGVYFVKIRTANGFGTARFVKE